MSDARLKFWLTSHQIRPGVQVIEIRDTEDRLVGTICPSGPHDDFEGIRIVSKHLDGANQMVGRTALNVSLSRGRRQRPSPADLEADASAHEDTHQDHPFGAGGQERGIISKAGVREGKP